MSTPLKMKNCAVCGDKALGYNFNAVTCESCKAFFRRNALAKKQFTCPFNQNCEITVVTRRFCQKCRLKKCLDIGMKSENIMSEEDKLIKRRKIETNRAKKRMCEKKLSVSGGGGGGDDRKAAAADSTGYDAYGSAFDSQSCNSLDSSTATMQPTSSTMLNDQLRDVNCELMTSEEMVEFIVADPDRASQAISKLMRTPAEAVASLEKIINCQKDALRLISHLIAYPGDALKIISKIMNSPFNALTVFTKFMSSPTDALEIISKIVSSPQDVLQFIRNLMVSPEDALDIMNKFMNTPAEALKMLNKIFNGSNEEAERESANNKNKDEEPKVTEERNTVIYAMLNNNSPGVQSPEPEHLQTLPVEQLGDDINRSNTKEHATNTQPSTITTHQQVPYTPTPPLQSPLSYTDASSNASSMHYHSPHSITDELPSTSSVMLLPETPPTTTNESSSYSEDHSAYDMKAFMQDPYAENSPPGLCEGINSLDSVLTEVIRIEFQAFNNLPGEPRVKQEQQQYNNTAFPMTGHQSTTDQRYCNPNPQPMCAPSSVSPGRELNDAEQMKLRELKMASEALYYPVDDDLSLLMMGDDRIKPEDAHQNPKLLQVINLTAVAIKRLIKMAKKITAFRDMCQEDQVALLKGGCTEMMIMRSVMTYDDDRNTWKIPHTKEDMSNIRAEVLKLAKGNVYEEHIKFISTFDEKWRMDENIILIMCAIVLFTPTRPRIVHTDVIKLEQNSYYYLLRRYLESVYPGCAAKSAFIRLIQKISDVERLNQCMINVYLNVNPAQVEPLLREIFDLKNH